LTEIVCPLPSISIPLPLRSGKFGTPLARMHLENASVQLVEPGALAEEAEEAETVGELDEPQAATEVAAASAAATVSSRTCRNGRLSWLCIGSPSPLWVQSRQPAVTVRRSREQLGKRVVYLAVTDDGPSWCVEADEDPAGRRPR
jgi:hypothetical protein